MRAPHRGHMSPGRDHPAEKSAHQPQLSVRDRLTNGEHYRSPRTSRRYEDTQGRYGYDYILIDCPR
jgi:hypothetical protein